MTIEGADTTRVEPLTHHMPVLHDNELPALPVMLGPEAEDFLNVLLAPSEGRVTSLRRSQVRYVPGMSITVQYQASIAWGKRHHTKETLVATTGGNVPDGVATVVAGDASIAVWRFPSDPFLPGLAPATNPRQAEDLVERLGARPGKARIRTRAYRPGRRAVIELNTPGARIFLKVVRPSKIARLQHNHSEFAGHLPVPHSLGWSDELGLVALQALPGRTLKKTLSIGSRALPNAAQLTELLDRFPKATHTTPSTRAAWQSAGDHAKLLSALLPRESAGIMTLAETLMDCGQHEPLTLVHGDFHPAQILLRGRDIVGLIDVDNAGQGHRSDDLAALLGHLATLAITSPDRRHQIDRYGSDLIRQFERAVEPPLLRRKVAAVIFALATGPFRVQQRNWPEATLARVALAERWMNDAMSKPSRRLTGG